MGGSLRCASGSSMDRKGKRMGIHRHLDDMLPFSHRRDWNELELHYQHLAVELAGSTLTSRISDVNLNSYELALQVGIGRALHKAGELSAKAVYFEYDLDNNWRSHFFICPTYSPLSVGDDDWACEWLATIEGPSQPDLGQLYSSKFDRPDSVLGSTLYLVARTVAAFGRSSTSATTSRWKRP